MFFLFSRFWSVTEATITKFVVTNRFGTTALFFGPSTRLSQRRTWFIFSQPDPPGAEPKLFDPSKATEEGINNASNVTGEKLYYNINAFLYFVTVVQRKCV